jgi:hypothetical protein
MGRNGCNESVATLNAKRVTTLGPTYVQKCQNSFGFLNPYISVYVRTYVVFENAETVKRGYIPTFIGQSLASFRDNSFYRYNEIVCK